MRFLWLWLLLQLTAIALAAARIPLSANWPTPGESLALHELVIIQIVGSALLWPLLLTSRVAAAITLATAWPFLFLAAFLGFVPLDRAVLLAVYISAWLLALSFLSFTFLSSRNRLAALAFTSLITLGPVLLSYLHGDFAPTTARNLFATTSLALDALDLLASPNRWRPRPWSFITILLILSAFGFGLSSHRRRISRRFLSPQQ